LTFDRDNTGQTLDVEWFLVEFTDETAVQRGTQNLASSTATGTIMLPSPVDPVRTIAVSGQLQTGGRTAYSADDNPGVAWATLDLINPSYLDMRRGNTVAAAAIPWQVITWPSSTYSIAGKVSEDVDGDGAVADDGVGVNGVNVWVYRDQGNGYPDAGDILAGDTTTNATGDWALAGLGAGTYWAAVDSRTIGPAAGFNGGFSLDDVWAEQTYAAAGAARFNGVWSYTTSADALYGGKQPTVSDGLPSLDDAEHVMRAVVSGANVTGLDTGFSFRAITNTVDDSTGGTWNATTSWESKDADNGAIGTNPEGYEHTVYDGRYVYFTPSLRTAGRHGEVLRYDTTGAFSANSSWATFDAGANGVGTDPDGYIGAIYDGRYVYFAPDNNGTAQHGEVLRYDTQASFTTAGSWSAFDPGGNGVGTDPDGYRGMEFDGRYVYFAPSNDGTASAGEVLRYDTTTSFSAAGSWSTYDPGAAGVGTDPDGYYDLVFDGRYLYFAPDNNGTAPHGEVLRYDTRAPFALSGSWATYDAGSNGVGSDPDGYGAAAFDGRYVYFAPTNNGTAQHGEVLRYDTAGAFTASTAWSTFDPGANGVGVDADGFRTITFDGRYVYFGQDNNGTASAGEHLRYDTRASFTSAASWSAYDPGASGVGTDPDGALGSVFDGRYVYFSHWYDGTDYSGEVLRYDTGRRGQGSLRQFITNGNAISGSQTSQFALVTTDPGYGGGYWTITPTSALPQIDDTLINDGTTQSGFSADPLVRLHGASAGAGVNGLTINAANSVLRSLSITGFSDDGVAAWAAGVTIDGNRIGVVPNALTVSANATEAVISSGNNQVITDNVIGGGATAGIVVSGGASGTLISGNYIGTNPAETVDYGAGQGLWTHTGTNITFTNNVVANSLYPGVEIGGTANNVAVIGNSLYDNAGLGIDLDGGTENGFGVTANDTNDADTGANGLLNFPVLTTPAAGATSLGITLDVPAGSYRIEVFENPTAGADGSGHGEGQTLVHTQTIIHPGGGSQPFTLTGLPAFASGDIVTATATRDLGSGSYGSTSEFSATATVIPPVNGPVVLDDIQKGTATIAAGSNSTTATITAVDPTKAFLTWTLRGNDANPDNLAVTGRLSNATTVTFTRAGTVGTVTIEWSVVEFTSGVLVQRGGTTLTGGHVEVVRAAEQPGRRYNLRCQRLHAAVAHVGHQPQHRHAIARQQRRGVASGHLRRRHGSARHHQLCDRRLVQDRNGHGREPGEVMVGLLQHDRGRNDQQRRSETGPRSGHQLHHVDLRPLQHRPDARCRL
jgi:hypothetical protein